MPAYSMLDTLSENERQEMLAKLAFVQDKVRDRKNVAVLRNFTLNIAEKCGCSTSNVSQVINGRNKNPQIIQEMYEYVASLFGTHLSAMNTGRQGPATVITGNKFSELEYISRKAMESGDDCERLLIRLKDTARELSRKLATFKELYADVDQKIPTNDDAYVGAIYEISGGGMQMNRLHVAEELPMMLDYFSAMDIRKTDFFDYFATANGITREEALALNEAGKRRQ